MNRKGVPTKPNKTDKATAADTVFTKNTTAKWIVDYKSLKRKPANFSCRMNFWHDSCNR